MEPISALVLVAVGAWITQIVLGWMQIQQFNRALASLYAHGRVCIGRSSAAFSRV